MTTDDHEIRTDLADMDLDLVHEWLSTDAYWSLGRTRAAVGTAAEHSLNFGAFTSDGRQVAYARVVTDHANFAWLCDVYVDRDHRGRGLGRRLVDECIRFAREKRYRKLVLWTQSDLDAARAIYRSCGFKLAKSEKHASFGTRLTGEYWELRL